MTLEVQSEQAISATMGKSQLEHGLLAGLIGLILVVIYTLFQYRALAAVTIGSLVVAGGTTFVIIDLLSWGMGYRLSLAGVAGLIVSIGITADSFIVYFERVKDELREGRSLVAAVEHGWARARRTILASDAVSFLAALVLYMLAVGSVRGFAFTLGLTTLIDLVVVFMFTHPTLGFLARTKFFGDGHRFSGLDPRQLGRDAIYKGRGRVLVPEGASRIRAHARRAQGQEGPRDRRHRREGVTMANLSNWGNRLHSGETTYPIVAQRKRWFAVSTTLVVLAILVLVFKGLTLGIDFKGGTEYTLSNVGSQSTTIATDVVVKKFPNSEPSSIPPE